MAQIVLRLTEEESFPTSRLTVAFLGELIIYAGNYDSARRFEKRGPRLPPLSLSLCAVTFFRPTAGRRKPSEIQPVWRSLFPNEHSRFVTHETDDKDVGTKSSPAQASLAWEGTRLQGWKSQSRRKDEG